MSCPSGGVGMFYCFRTSRAVLPSRSLQTQKKTSTSFKLSPARPSDRFLAPSLSRNSALVPPPSACVE